MLKNDTRICKFPAQQCAQTATVKTGPRSRQDRHRFFANCRFSHHWRHLMRRWGPKSKRGKCGYRDEMYLKINNPYSDWLLDQYPRRYIAKMANMTWKITWAGTQIGLNWHTVDLMDIYSYTKFHQNWTKNVNRHVVHTYRCAMGRFDLASAPTK